MLKIIMRTTGDRDIGEYLSKINNLLISRIQKRDAYENFQNALVLTKGHNAVYLEDDIILCDDFERRVKDIIKPHENEVIQFFSMRKDDIAIGTRYINGAKFMMMQCVYLPARINAELLEYSYTWDRTGHIAGVDLMLADYLKLKKIKYLNICPNLVDHKVSKSLIDPRRSSKRQSLTFREA
ncbi:MAG: hypothetical protein LBJ41_01735 [Treponema sp.]|jgi:GR25 family glycosyltransferase involved in LPS biosynthesis|nr:hypothetical protein [Treponema sp.]